MYNGICQGMSWQHLDQPFVVGKVKCSLSALCSWEGVILSGILFSSSGAPFLGSVLFLVMLQVIPMHRDFLDKRKHAMQLQKRNSTLGHWMSATQLFSHHNKV